MELSSIKKNPDNPRIIKDEKFEKLCDSIQAFPDMLALRPIVVDENNVVLGGNMRLAALKHLKYKDVPDNWVLKASELTEEQKQRFVLTDNASFGVWDWDVLANEWDSVLLDECGIDVPAFGGVEDSDEFGTEFDLKEGDKEPFQQITFTFSDEQATEIKNLIAEIKKTDEYKYMETSGNENSNGNALYLICKQWAEQKTSF